MPTLHQIANLLPSNTRLYINDKFAVTAGTICEDWSAEDCPIAFRKDCRVTGIRIVREGAIDLEVKPPVEAGEEPAGE